MDDTASNYNSAATTQPDNACNYLGCTDAAATNPTLGANVDDGSCLYLITGCWEWQTGVVNGDNVFSAAVGISEVVLYFWDDGQFGIEYYTPDGLAQYDIGTYSLSANQTTATTTTMSYVRDASSYWITNFETTSTVINIAKFNSNELNGGWNDNDGIGNFTSNKSSTYFLNGWK